MMFQLKNYHSDYKSFLKVPFIVRLWSYYNKCECGNKGCYWYRDRFTSYVYKLKRYWISLTEHIFNRRYTCMRKLDKYDLISLFQI